MQPEDEIPLEVNIDHDDVRLGFDLIRRSLDEDGWAIGREGFLACRYAEKLGRGWHEAASRDATHQAPAPSRTLVRCTKCGHEELWPHDHAD